VRRSDELVSHGLGKRTEARESQLRGIVCRGLPSHANLLLSWAGVPQSPYSHAEELLREQPQLVEARGGPALETASSRLRFNRTDGEPADLGCARRPPGDNGRPNKPVAGFSGRMEPAGAGEAPRGEPRRSRQRSAAAASQFTLSGETDDRRVVQQAV
jgi:hypothetical protein